MIRFLKGAAAVAGCALAAASWAQPKFWDTGEGLAGGMADGHWTATRVEGSTLHFGTTSSYVMDEATFPVVGAYVHNGFSTSKWISFSLDGLCNSDDIFRFDQTFYLDPALFGSGGGTGNTGNNGHSDAGATLKGLFSSDNASAMYVNTQLVAELPFYTAAQGYSWQARKAFDASTYLRGGWNTVSFLVGSGDTMGGNTGPNVEWLGLRVEGELTTSAVPEPGTWAALGLGAAALARRRRRGP